jgi:F0F1-type ATP synthase assembly protein I
MVQGRLPDKASGSGSSPSQIEGVAGYLVAGVCLFGGLGLVLDRWLGLSFLTPVGLALGGIAGGYLVYLRAVRQPQEPAVDNESGSRTASEGEGR